MGDYDFKTTEFKVSGFADLYKTVEHIGQAALARELAPMLTEALEPMRDAARAFAPDDPITGPPWNLNTSIEISTRQRSGRQKRDSLLGENTFAQAFMGPTKFGYPEAIFAEFGTTLRFQKDPTKSTGAMRAVPYMRPAWDGYKQTTLKIIEILFPSHIMAVARKYGPRR